MLAGNCRNEDASSAWYFSKASPFIAYLLILKLSDEGGACCSVLKQFVRVRISHSSEIYRCDCLLTEQ